MDWASLTVGHFQVQAPKGGYIWRANFNSGIFSLPLWGAGSLYLKGFIHGGLI